MRILSITLSIALAFGVYFTPQKTYAALSDSDVSTLYNSGTGISCADVLNPASPIIKSFKVEGGTIKTEGTTMNFE